MKKLFLLVLTLSLGFAAFAGSDEEEEKPDPNPVPIVRGDYTDQIKLQPRSLVPITCYYIGDEVVLGFLYDLGEVEADVTSQTTGEQWLAYGDAADGELRIAASSESGSYVVRIRTADGSIWHGCYTR